MKKHPRRTLVIADMHKSMPKGARILAAGLHEIVNLPANFALSIDLDRIDFNKREIVFANPDDSYADAALRALKKTIEKRVVKTEDELIEVVKELKKSGKDFRCRWRKDGTHLVEILEDDEAQAARLSTSHSTG